MVDRENILLFVYPTNNPGLGSHAGGRTSAAVLTPDLEDGGYSVVCKEIPAAKVRIQKLCTESGI
jgi:hypothetical protein